ncbi:hypothetical protein EJ06DRAFT_580828 [Trichodelitschia bisporula]|uniref:UBR-type domain-containing protein n=1 Tax=Trichodelitschia bisporula TaxID=703511 RepID=A0A6G1I347_9PEZI|nr:hypothetical protein EJ06DRAFT_580828 [Trichodelitschia bisporula]
MPSANEMLPPNGVARKNSASQASDNSQTAQEFINSQLELEAEAREAFPYQFDTCTRPLGPLRQLLFSCLTCNPPPSTPDEPYTPAGVCYACSISCHGEHELVELFNKRNFVCDCGTTRLPPTAPCGLRVDDATGRKSLIHTDKPAESNRYNQNFRNKFCGCGREYDAHQEKGTMYQCLGLGTVEEGGCGEDWWHPECVVGVERDGKEGEEMPPGFPKEEEFDHFICYKCTDAYPWIKRYAGTQGFLPPVYHRPGGVKESDSKPEVKEEGAAELEVKAVEMQLEAPPKVESETTEASLPVQPVSTAPTETPAPESRKRKASDDISESDTKRTMTEAYITNTSPSHALDPCRYSRLPPAPEGQVSIFMEEDYYGRFCRCESCFPRLAKHQQLMEEEDTYEPPLSSEADGEPNGGSVGTGSLLERGEAALSNVDRVRAIEGVMVYNHLKDQVKNFLKPFADSGKAVGAEDIKAYFEKLRGDSEAIKAARGGATEHKDGGGGDGDGRREQSGY